MDTSLECVPCLFRQTLDAVRRHSDDADFHERVLREVAGWVHQTDLKQPPPLIAQRLHRFLCVCYLNCENDWRGLTMLLGWHCGWPLPVIK